MTADPIPAYILPASPILPISLYLWGLSCSYIAKHGGPVTPWLPALWCSLWAGTNIGALPWCCAQCSSHPQLPFLFPFFHVHPLLGSLALPYISIVLLSDGFTSCVLVFVLGAIQNNSVLKSYFQFCTPENWFWWLLRDCVLLRNGPESSMWEG